MFGMGMMGGLPPPVMMGGPMMGGMGMPFGRMPNPRSMPGWFGRDLLGREFSGPGGAGHSNPYRPPDPGVLPPMPTGLPIMARPPKKGLDAYGRPIPPQLPPGIDGWGRPIPGPDGQFPYPPGPPGMMAGPGGMMMPNQGQQMPQAAPPAAPANPPVEEVTGSGGADLGVTSDSGRPEEPPAFHRQPSKDDHNDFRDFAGFSFPSTALAHIHRLRRPPELKHCDVRSDEWAYFIEGLELETYKFADKSHLSTYGSYSDQDKALLTEDVHRYLRAWQVGYFGPRGIKIYPAKEGRRLFAPGLTVSSHRGYGNTKSTITTIDFSDESSSDFSDDQYDPREDAQYSARERSYRRRQRKLLRREDRERRKRKKLATEDWEVHFAWMQPTPWKAGMKPIQYGEKRPAFERPDDY